MSNIYRKKISFFRTMWINKSIVDLLYPCKRLHAGGYYGWQSSLYAKASQIDRPLSRSYFKEQSGRLCPSFHTARYRSVCRIRLLSRNGQFAKTVLSPVRSNILLAARLLPCQSPLDHLGKPCPQVLRYRDIAHRKDYPLSWAVLGSYRFGQDNIRIPSAVFHLPIMNTLWLLVSTRFNLRIVVSTAIIKKPMPAWINPP